MRTVQVDGDYVAKYEKIAKNTYRFEVAHAATGRPITEGNCRTRPGSFADQTAEDVASEARTALARYHAKREATSIAFADGKSVPNAPALAPVHAKSATAGELDISAELPVRLIRDAYKVAGIVGESMESWLVRCGHAALDMGHKVLIGAPDALILAIARGELTLHGSLRSGVTIVAAR